MYGTKNLKKRIWTKFLASLDLERLLTKTKKRITAVTQFGDPLNLYATSGKNCLLAKTACRAPSKPQLTTIKERKKALTMS
jgi:hypothetical protein